MTKTKRIILAVVVAALATFLLTSAMPHSVTAQPSPISIQNVSVYNFGGNGYGINVTYNVPEQTAINYIVCFNITVSNWSENGMFFCYSNSSDWSSDGTQYLDGALVYMGNGFISNIGNWTVPTNNFILENLNIGIGAQVTIEYYLLQGNAGHNQEGYTVALSNPQVVAGSEDSYMLVISPSPTPSPTPTASPTPTPTLTPDPTATPTATPTTQPTNLPANTPSASPTSTPSTIATPSPTASPTEAYTATTTLTIPEMPVITTVALLMALIIGIAVVKVKSKGLGHE